MKILNLKSIGKVLLSISLVFVLVGLTKSQDRNFENKVFAKEEKAVENFKEMANVSSEEKFIRRAYQKLSVYEVVDKFSRAERERRSTGQALAQKALKFKLKNFQIGRIEEIQNLPFSDLVTLPTGDIIDITPISTSVNSDEYKFSVKAKWKNGQYSSGFDSQWTLGNLMQLDPNKYQNVGKYASYEVTVSFEEKTRTYLALVLFHNSYESSQNLSLEFLDYIVGMGDIVTRVFNEAKLPLGTRQRNDSNQNFQDMEGESKLVRKTDKNQSTQSLSSSCEVNWYPGCGSCLEWYLSPIATSTYCLVWSPLVNTGGGGSGEPSEPTGCQPSVFYASQGQDIDSSDTEHNSGNHQAHTLLDHTCLQNQNCQTNCKIVDTIAQITDEGRLVRLTLHSTAKDVKVNERSGPRNTTVQCETAVGYGVKSCWSVFGCNASVSIGISGAGQSAQVSLTPNDNLYNRSYIYGGSCRNGH